MDESSMEIEAEELTQSLEGMKSALKSSVFGGLTAHYGAFAGMTSLKLILRYLLPDPKDHGDEVEKILTTWKSEVSGGSAYSDYCKRASMLKTNHPEAFSEVDFDSIFREAMDEVAEEIRLHLKEGPCDLSSKVRHG